MEILKEEQLDKMFLTPLYYYSGYWQIYYKDKLLILDYKGAFSSKSYATRCFNDVLRHWIRKGRYNMKTSLWEDSDNWYFNGKPLGISTKEYREVVDISKQLFRMGIFRMVNNKKND